MRTSNWANGLVTATMLRIRAPTLAQTGKASGSADRLPGPGAVAAWLEHSEDISDASQIH